MIREGGWTTVTAAAVEVAQATQFRTLGGSIFLTVRAGAEPTAAEIVSGKGAVPGVVTTATWKQFTLSLGTNDIAVGPVLPLRGEEMPVLWQGQIGPGNLFLNLSPAGAVAGTAVNIAFDFTAS